MKLKLKPSKTNSFPFGGFLIKGARVKDWLMELQQIGLSLEAIQLLPVPGESLNSIWGCLVLPSVMPEVSLLGKHELCQQVCPTLFIPEKSEVFPKLTERDIRLLFSEKICLMHPEIGLAELDRSFNIADLLVAPERVDIQTTPPKPKHHYPSKIKSFRIVARKEEEVIKEMEDLLSDPPKKMDDQPLSLGEKFKFGLYKALFSKDADQKADGIPNETEFLKAIKGFGDALMSQGWSEKMRENFEELARRNQKAADKLLDMLKNNPDEGLKYAIPIDNNNSGRGWDGMPGSFTLDKRWDDSAFSNLFGGLFGMLGGGGGGGSSIDMGSYTDKLAQQYRETAERLIKEKKYRKAAFVYMKLLKDYFEAARTLEKGKIYEEAATIYLRYLNDKNRAAICYEQGNMFAEAIDLYKEMNQFEKVGDLYMKLNDREMALIYYQKRVEEYLSQKKYFDAAALTRNKIKNVTKSQEILMEAWTKNIENSRCLNHYLRYLPETADYTETLQLIYDKKVTKHQLGTFINVLEVQFKQKTKEADFIRDLAYQVISRTANLQPNVVEKIRTFNQQDQEIGKDIGRFGRG